MTDLDTPEFTMPFQPSTIEHLGLRLYSTLPPVIAELVSNAFDADSPKVEVILPDGQLTPEVEVIVRDWGHGMSEQVIQNEFLPIGRNRRGSNSANRRSKSGARLVTGRKGLGKLSGLGVAQEMEIRSVCEGKAICLLLRYEDMKSWPEKHGAEPYRPTFVHERSGLTMDPNGVEITLRRLRRASKIDPVSIRQGLARRLSFIGVGFDVKVNGTSVQAGDRVQRSACAMAFDIPEPNDPSEIGQMVKGWIGFVEKSSQADRGVDIFATKKAVQLESFFNLPSTHAQFARAHVVGEIHADFLDDQEDLASTARNSVVWESTDGQRLQSWGQDLLKRSFDRWLKHRRENREDDVIRAGKFDEWLTNRSDREQKVARKLVKLLASNEELDTSTITPLLEMVKGSVETVAFNDLVDTMDEEGATVATLVKLFHEWRVIEAREHLRLADGRLSAIEQLSHFIDEGALEVKELQPLLSENLWLLDPGWTDAFVEKSYSALLRERFKEPHNMAEKNRRIDILGVTDAHRITVVELKRPDVELNFDHLVQLEQYVYWARKKLATESVVDGLLLVGRLSDDASVLQKMQDMKPLGMRVATLRELTHRGSEYFSMIERQLKNVAPEFARNYRKGKKVGPKN